MDLTKAEERRAWGRFEFAAPGRGVWRVGPLTLWIERTDSEWLVATQRSGDPWDDAFSVECPASKEEKGPPEGVGWQRFGFTSIPTAVLVTPRVADRAVVSRPEMPVVLPPGQGGRFYVGSPVWIEIRADGAGEPLADVPTWRPSDTWFGSTREGELSYATRTRLRRHLADLPMLKQRITTPLRIDNRAENALSIEKLSLPITHLSVFEAEDGHLWTEPVRLLRESSDESGAVDVEQGPPREAAGARRLSGPRETHESVFVSRLFGKLF